MISKHYTTNSCGNISFLAYLRINPFNKHSFLIEFTVLWNSIKILLSSTMIFLHLMYCYFISFCKRFCRFSWVYDHQRCRIPWKSINHPQSISYLRNLIMFGLSLHLFGTNLGLLFSHGFVYSVYCFFHFLYCSAVCTKWNGGIQRKHVQHLIS